MSTFLLPALTFTFLSFLISLVYLMLTNVNHSKKKKINPVIQFLGQHMHQKTEGILMFCSAYCLCPRGKCAQKMK